MHSTAHRCCLRCRPRQIVAHQAVHVNGLLLAVRALTTNERKRTPRRTYACKAGNRTASHQSTANRISPSWSCSSLACLSVDSQSSSRTSHLDSLSSCAAQSHRFCASAKSNTHPGVGTVQHDLIASSEAGDLPANQPQASHEVMTGISTTTAAAGPTEVGVLLTFTSPMYIDTANV